MYINNQCVNNKCANTKYLKIRNIQQQLIHTA